MTIAHARLAVASHSGKRRRTRPGMKIQNAIPVPPADRFMSRQDLCEHGKSIEVEQRIFRVPFGHGSKPRTPSEHPNPH